MLELLFLLWVFDVIDQEHARKFMAIDEGNAKIIVGAVSLFFVSGAAGYLIGNLYHFMLHRLELFDYRAVLASLTRKRFLVVKDLDGTEPDFETHDYLRDWVIVNNLWHRDMKGEDSGFKSALPRAESLSDTTHRLGALFVGSMLALVIAIILAVRQGFYEKGFSACSFLWGIAIGAGIVIVHGYSFRRIKLLTRDFIATVVLNEVKASKVKPVTLYFQNLKPPEPSQIATMRTVPGDGPHRGCATNEDTGK